MNESRFLFVLCMIFLNPLDEGRRTYSLYRMCELSLIILLALRSTCFSYKAMTEDGLRPAILLLISYNALQFIVVFLVDVPKPTYKRKCQNTLYTKWVKHG